jgi:glutamate racemase
LAEHHLANPKRHEPDYRYYVTDIPLRFQSVGERFLGRSLGKLEMVQL